MTRYLVHYHYPNVERTEETLESLSAACELAANRAWRALCNGRGMVPGPTRKILKRAEKTATDPDYTGTIFDALTGQLERATNRAGSVTLTIDGLTYGVERVETLQAARACFARVVRENAGTA
jgi:hypothetical protein